MQFIAYYRVSTAKQGASGLGLEAQRKAVLGHVQGQPIAEYVEVESGKCNARPQLEAAMRHARVAKSTLIVAKLDRLSRNAGFLNALADSKLAFVCCDMPFADRLTIGIMAQLAQWEAEQISKRTKEALAAAKARGRKLGGHRGPARAVSAVGRQRSIQTRQAQAASSRSDLMHFVEQARAAGHATLQAIADYLNSNSIQTVRGGQWYAASVARLLKKGQERLDHTSTQRGSQQGGMGSW